MTVKTELRIFYGPVDQRLVSPPFQGGDEGSTPFGTTSYFYGGVTQLARVSALQAESREFKSLHFHLG